MHFTTLTTLAYHISSSVPLAFDCRAVAEKGCYYRLTVRVLLKYDNKWRIVITSRFATAWHRKHCGSFVNNKIVLQCNLRNITGCQFATCESITTHVPSSQSGNGENGMRSEVRFDFSFSFHLYFVARGIVSISNPIK